MGDVSTATNDRKLVKLDEPRHYRLKKAAARRKLTMLDLLGLAVDAYLDREEAELAAQQRKPSRKRAESLSA